MSTTFSNVSRIALVAMLAITACRSAARTAPDPRVGLKAGHTNAAEAVSNLQVNSSTMSPPVFAETMNADLAFTGNHAIQGNFNGPVIWDVSNPSNPTLVASVTCPASQNDVSVYRNLLFVSVESNNSTLDCRQMTLDTVDARRFRGVRIFDIRDIRNPRLIHNVQTCRGSHTHSVLEDPRDRDNVYIYVSGSSSLRSPSELAGCISAPPDSVAASGLWRIEIIRVPLANPAAAAVVSRANIFAGLKAAPSHGESPEDIIANKRMADSARAAFSPSGPTPIPGVSPISTFSQCHDITLYPALGIAGGACEGHGILLDIRDPTNPKRIDAVADSNFAYWHSATFNNDGTKILFSDEWGGGGAPKCRVTDKKEWGANAIFEIVNGKMEFRSYYKLPAAQTALENCVAHNGSIVPVPGRDIMVQGWYQGGISVFDFTDARHPKEIAYQDRGPLDSTRFTMGGSWSAYWYNGAIVSSEIARGLDAMELIPSEHLTQNEIDAAKTVKLTYFNAQGQPKFSWPPSFPLVKAYLDQLERSKCLPGGRVTAVRGSIAAAEASSGTQRTQMLSDLASQLENDKRGSCDASRLTKMQQAMRDLARPLVP